MKKSPAEAGLDASELLPNSGIFKNTIRGVSAEERLRDKKRWAAISCPFLVASLPAWNYRKASVPK